MKKYGIEPSVIRDGLPIILYRVCSQVLTNPYLRHNILLFGTNILAGIFAYLLHPFLARMMSIQEYGQVAALIALSLVLTIPTQVIQTVAAKYVSTLSTSGNEAQLNDFIRRLTTIFLVVGVAITAVLVVISSYVTSFFRLDSRQEIILLSLIFIVSFIIPLNMGVLQGLQRFGWLATVTLLIPLFRLVLSIGFLLIGFGVNGAILGIVMSDLLAYIISFQPLWKILKGSRRPIGSLHSLWFYSIFTAIATGSIVVLYSIDTVLARHFLNAHDAGLYAALATIGRTVLFVTSSVGIVMFPRVVAFHESGTSHTRVAMQAILGVVVLSATVEGAFCIAPTFITQLLFGRAFLPIAGHLALYGLAMLLLAVGQVVMTYFLAIGNRSFVLIILSACALQTILIVWRHNDIAQLVQSVIVTNAALVLALLITFSLKSRMAREVSRASVNSLDSSSM